MSMNEIRAYVLLFIVALTLAITIHMEPLFRLGLVLLGLLALKHAATEQYR